VGRGEGLGRPLLYGTSNKFLEHFGFGSLEDLPRPDELPVVLRARPVVAATVALEAEPPAEIEAEGNGRPAGSSIIDPVLEASANGASAEPLVTDTEPTAEQLEESALAEPQTEVQPK
jgi:hypothetical protein